MKKVLIFALSFLLAACTGTSALTDTLPLAAETPVATTMPAPSEVISSPTASVTVRPTVDPRFWGENAPRYGTFVIADRGEDAGIFLFNGDGTLQRIYRLSGSYQPWRADQIVEGCNLVVQAANVTTDYQSSVYNDELIQLDPEGNMIRSLFSLERTGRPGSIRFIPVLSPTGNHVAYGVFSGELYYDTAEYQDIEIVSLDQPNRPIHVTSHGGAWKYGGAWSPDGSRYAYSDFDETGISQLYLIEIGTMIRYPATQFQDPDWRVGPVNWSPGGDRLAILLLDPSENGEVWIIDLEQGTTWQLNISSEILLVAYRMFWNRDGNVLLLSVGDYTGSDLAGLYWFDVDGNQLIHVLTETSANRINSDVETFAYLFPLTSDLSEVAFYNSVNLWHSYDVLSGDIETLPWLSSRQWGSHLSVDIFPEDIFACGR